MTDEVLIKKIVTALEDKLAEMVIADHLDALNAVTEVMTKILKTAEFLLMPQAYRRAAIVFADAAVAEEAEAKATAKASRPARRVLKMSKLEQFQNRQRRVAARAAKRKQCDGGQP
jgi:hypothetical protein